MNEGLISKRYAKALLEYATELGEEEKLYERMHLLSQTLSSIPHLRATLGSPVVSKKDKKQLITEAGGRETEKSFEALVRVISKNHREPMLQNIALSYLDIYRRAKRITVVSLVSATPLSEQILDKFKTEVEKRTRSTVELETKIDPSLKGGFIFQIDDLRLDASVKGQLEKIRQQLVKGTRDIM